MQGRRRAAPADRLHLKIAEVEAEGTFVKVADAAIFSKGFSIIHYVVIGFI